MAASPPPPPPQPPPPTPAPAPTTIAALSDVILRDIFLRLPDVASLARAAFACRAFLHAVRSSPAFRRRFRELHAPPLLALFREPDMRAIVPEGAGESSDSDAIVAAFAAFDGLLEDPKAPESDSEAPESDSEAPESEWRTESGCCYAEGYAIFYNEFTEQGVWYSPHSQALNIYPPGCANGCLLEFHTLSADGDEQLPSRVVCIHRKHTWAWARVAVFSSHTMEWQVVLPKMHIRGVVGENDRYRAGACFNGFDRYSVGKVVNGFVCWVHKGKGHILALNTATFQFSRMDLPPPLKERVSRFQLGQTKDGEFCVIGIVQCMLSVWLWTTSSDGVERFILHKTISLRANVSEITECSEEADVRMRSMAVINGFVYLSLIIDYWGDTESPEWFLSLCLETAEVNLLHKECPRFWCSFDPYVMVSWPSSLIHGKEDSEIGVTGNISEPMGKEEASPVLFTALQSFKEKLIDDGNSKFADIESFLLDDERNSLLNRIATLESGLAVARDRVLRIRTKPNSMNRKRKREEKVLNRY